MFSKACEYAIRAVLIVAIKGKEESKLSIQEIAKEIDSPLAFTAKIMQTLTREKLVASVKGPNGGFYIDPKAKPVSLNQIVQAMEAENVLNTCALGLKECSDVQPCPIHYQVKAYKNRLKSVMEDKTVQGLAKELAEGKTFLKISRKRKSG